MGWLVFLKDLFSVLAVPQITVLGGQKHPSLVVLFAAVLLDEGADALSDEARASRHHDGHLLVGGGGGGAVCLGFFRHGLRCE